MGLSELPGLGWLTFPRLGTFSVIVSLQIFYGALSVSLLLLGPIWCEHYCIALALMLSQRSLKLPLFLSILYFFLFSINYFLYSVFQLSDPSVPMNLLLSQSSIYFISLAAFFISIWLMFSFCWKLLTSGVGWRHPCQIQRKELWPAFEKLQSQPLWLATVAMTVTDQPSCPGGVGRVILTSHSVSPSFLWVLWSFLSQLPWTLSQVDCLFSLH